MTFIKNEANPKVRIFNGNEIILRTGLRILKRIQRTKPPKIKVVTPPFTFTPEKTCVSINKAKALVNVALKIDFIGGLKVTKKCALCQQI